MSMALSAGENPAPPNAGSAETGNLNITVDFGGGMEVLFSYKRSHEVSLPRSLASSNNSNGKVTIGDLIGWLLENLLSDKTRPELFASAILPASPSTTDGGIGGGGGKSLDGTMKEGDMTMKKSGGRQEKVEYTVRPGILVLVNDTDWELEGERGYELQEGDNIMFISTLHGG